MLEQLLKDLSTKDSSRLAPKRSGEIKALLEEIRSDNNAETVTENLPDDIQDYRFRLLFLITNSKCVNFWTKPTHF